MADKMRGSRNQLTVRNQFSNPTIIWFFKCFQGSSAIIDVLGCKLLNDAK